MFKFSPPCFIKRLERLELEYEHALFDARICRLEINSRCQALEASLEAVRAELKKQDALPRLTAVMEGK